MKFEYLLELLLGGQWVDYYKLNEDELKNQVSS
jgi:hypothetical protein